MVQTGMEFLQKSSKSSVALRAKGLLVSLMQTGRAHTTQLSLMASALQSKAVDFSKITEQIDGMIDVLTAEIKALDKAVAQATEQRKEEHAVFLQTQAEGSAAVQLIEAAKNKLNKFYNPTMYKAPERRELTEEERIAVANGAVDPRDAEEAAAAGQGIAGTGITVFAQVRAASDAAPPPPPETFG